MNSLVDNNLMLAKIALQISKQDAKYKEEAINYIVENNSELGYIQIANMIFSFYTNLYDVSATNAEKNNALDCMKLAFNDIFANNYIRPECWDALIHIRNGHGQIRMLKDDIEVLIKLLDKQRHPITTIYIYRRLANYIVDGGLFFVEPFTTMLEQIINDIDGADFDPSAQPNYLS